MKYYSETDFLKDNNLIESKVLKEFGCGFCWDKKKNESKELFFLDNANNMRLCTFCPNCGRKYEEDSY